MDQSVSIPSGAGRVGGVLAATPSARSRQVELVLGGLDQLPTLSPVAVRLLGLTSAADSDFDEVVRVIESDPALTVKMLSLCKRASVGASRTITTVKRATVMLGLEAVQAAALSVHIYELMQQAPKSPEAGASVAKGGFDRERFWRHSIASGVCAELVAASCVDVGVNSGEAFTAGLVHDIGKLALDWILPRTYDQIMRQVGQQERMWASGGGSGSSVSELERATIGLDHCQAGKRLGEHWSLPHMMIDAMWLHGQLPESMPDIAGRNLVGIVAIGSALAVQLELGGGNLSGGLGHRLSAWCNALGVAEGVLEGVLSRAPSLIAERCEVLGLSYSSTTEVSQEQVAKAIGSANRKLAKLHEHARALHKSAQGHAKALAIVSEFASSQRAGGTLADAMIRISDGWKALCGHEAIAVICQARAGEPWRVLCPQRVFGADADEGQREVRSIEPPMTSGGEAMDLKAVGQGGSLGAAYELAQWMCARVQPQSDDGGASAAGVLVRNASNWRMMPLVSAIGPVGLIVYDGVDLSQRAEESGVSSGALATVVTVWSWAIGVSAQAEGARRLSEQLARTARELAEAQHRLAEAQSMARLGEFTSGAAHEMNNPLTVISGRAQLLASRAKPGADKDEILAIVKASESLTDLITQLHMVASPAKPKVEQTLVRAWLEGVGSEASRRARGNGLVCAPMSIEADGQMLAMIDSVQLARAVGELVSNAIQSAPKTGIVLRASQVDYREGPGSGIVQTLRVEVIDDGRGMNDHVRRHAFDPFFSERTAGRQRGLGLALAKRIVESHGGRIGLESKSSKGTTAWVEVAIGAIAAGGRGKLSMTGSVDSARLGNALAAEGGAMNVGQPNRNGRSAA